MEGTWLYLELPALFLPLGDVPCSGVSLVVWEASVSTFEMSSGRMVGKPGVTELPGSAGRGPEGRLVGLVGS